MKIVGGCYRELCEVPRWDALFGSGGRAAAAVGRVSPGTTLHTYCPIDRRAEVEALFQQYGVTTIGTESSGQIAFAYFQPLSRPVIEPSPSLIPNEAPILVNGEVVLRFGFLEGDAVVHADRAIYDPQTGGTPASFRANGSTAGSLAVVLNEAELHRMAGRNDLEAPMIVMERERASVLVVKQGVRGATVFQAGTTSHSVPAYFSEQVFKIGSGDIFSAAFAYYWGDQGFDAVKAADLASRSTAYYCGQRLVTLSRVHDLDGLRPVPRGTLGKVAIAASTATIGQRWAAEEAHWCLQSLGADVSRTPDGDISPLDIGDCTALLALADGNFGEITAEIQRARAIDLPVVVLLEAAYRHPQASMKFVSLGCEVVDDFASSLYRVAWASIR